MCDAFKDDNIAFIFMLIHVNDKHIDDLVENLGKNLTFINLRSFNEAAERETIDIEQSYENNDEYLNYIRSAAYLDDNVDVVGDISSNTLGTVTNSIEHIKRYLPRCKKRSVPLNYFYEKVIDDVTVTAFNTKYLETYGVKMLLVANNQLNRKYLKIFADRFITEIDIIKNGIKDEVELNKFIENNLKHDLIFDELLDFDVDLPLHNEVKSVYQKYGMIYYSDFKKCVI